MGSIALPEWQLKVFLMKSLRLIFIAFLNTSPFMLTGQTDDNFPPPTQPPVITAQKAQGEIKVDGKLSEPSWLNVPSITDFFRMEPRQGGVYKHQTAVKLQYDEKYLYVGVFCQDSLGQKRIRIQDLRRDFTWSENDNFILQLDPQNLKQYCVSFQTTPYGNQGDLQEQ